jgi:hypothetical protein
VLSLSSESASTSFVACESHVRRPSRTFTTTSSGGRPRCRAARNPATLVTRTIRYPVLFFLTTTSCALTGWCFGFGYFVVCFYWVGHAFLVDAETFGWLLPVAVIGGPAYLAIYTAIGFAVAHLLWVRSAVRILAFAVALTGAEWLRGQISQGPSVSIRPKAICAAPLGFRAGANTRWVQFRWAVAQASG